MIELLLAAALAQPCMIPKAHHHKVKPIATCIAPHIIMFTPEPDIEPIPLPLVVTKFVTPLASIPVAPTYDCDYPNYCDSIEWDYAAGGYFAGGYVAAIGTNAPTVTGIEPIEPGTPTRPIYPVPPMGRAPEIDAASGGSMVTLLIGLLVVIRSGKSLKS